MVFLRIVIILAVLIIALLSLNLKIFLKYDGTICLRVGIGPVVLNILPKKEKKLRLRDFTYDKYYANLEKKKKKQLKKAEKKKKKHKSDEPKSDAPAESGNSEDKLFTVSSVLDFISSEFPKAISKLKINIKKLIITVGGSDAAKIALSYGKVEAAVSLIIELLDNKTKLSPIKEGTVMVYADFLSEKTTVNFDFSVKISIGSILGIAIGVVVWFIKNKFASDAEKISHTANNTDMKTA